MTVTNPNVNGGAATSMAWPPSGVIYVGNGTCGARYNPLKWYLRTPGCGDVHVSGTYTKDLTIAAQNDVVVTEERHKAHGSDALLGLIADQFVRVWHPVDDRTGTNYSSCDEDGSPTNMQIDAAILALNGSFTVDNYWCGARWARSGERRDRPAAPRRGGHQQRQHAATSRNTPTTMRSSSARRRTSWIRCRPRGGCCARASSRRPA